MGKNKFECNNKSISFTRVKTVKGRWRVQLRLFGIYLTVSNARLKFRQNQDIINDKIYRIKLELLAERGYTCELCGKTLGKGVKCELHHVKPQSKYPDLRYERTNLMLLCHDCHVGLHTGHEMQPATAKKEGAA